MTPEIQPSSIPRVTRRMVWRNGVVWVPIYCANCGKDGGHVPEDAATFAFALCEPCGEKWAPLAGTMLVPDEVFLLSVKEAQMETFGRLLEVHEIIAALQDENHILTKLCRDRASYVRRD